MSIKAESQRLEKDPLVSLYTLDLRPIGENTVLPFTQNTMSDGSKVMYDGVEYEPIDIDASGFEVSANGQFPRPVVRMPNAGLFATSIIVAFGDITGAKFTRLRTYQKYLDGGSEGGQGIAYSPDIYFVEQRTKLTGTEVTWQLSSSMDFQGTKLPRRLALRDVCSHRYRIWNEDTQSFDYGTCPYVGGVFFDNNDVQTNDPSLDNCSRKLSGCQNRFGVANELPTWSFPAMARTRI